MSNLEPQGLAQIPTTQVSVTQDLPLYKETERFIFFCEPVDNQIADTVLAQYESCFAQFSKDFDHVYSAKITFKIYPNTEEQLRTQWIEYLIQEYGAENKPAIT